MNKQGYDELNISQIPALDVLERLGYQIITPEEAETMRGSLYNVILKPILKKQLQRINTYEFKGQTHAFSDANIDKALQDINVPLSDGLIKANEKIYDILTLGKSYEERISKLEGVRSFNMNYIDFEHPENNVFHAVEEFTVEREDGQGHVRPDIVLFINGIPFAVIECKRASVSIEQGISQMIRNQGKDYIPQLFKYIQVVMSTNKNNTKYATVYTPAKFWSLWKEDKKNDDHTWHQQTLKDVVDRIPTTQDKNIVSLFHPNRILDLIRYYILFDRTDKKIARYQQYFAVKEIIKTVKKKDMDGTRNSGVIWHTQGSGKSLTMVMLAKYLLDELASEHPQLIIVTDRIELDSQIHKTFNHSRLRAAKAKSGKNLVELIATKKADVITTLVHKFDLAAKQQEPIMDPNVFVLVDESHRTQYGELHVRMKQVFPNACYLGFTGTPLMKKEKSTMQKFGRLIHTYTIRDGVNDGTIVPLLYEGRFVEQSINRKAIDKRLEMITRHLNDKQERLLKQKWAKFENIASSEQRIQLIAYDIYVHFTKFYQGTAFKAMLATNSKFDAIRYQKAFEENDDITTKVVISPPDQREGQDEVDGEPKDRVIAFWNTIMKGYRDAQSYEDAIKNEFVEGDGIDILIVVDKLLTGFDAPRASVLYIDKPMKDHSLLQAIARVNRIYEGKDYGLIIDYRGLIDELDSAMQVYSGSGLENFDSKDIAGALVDVISVLGKLRESYTQLLDFFKDIKDKTDNEAYELTLEDDEIRTNFYNALSTFAKYLSIGLESEHVYKAIKEDEMKRYKKDLKYFQELRAAVKIRYSDAIDHKEYEPKMRKLMDQYIAAEEVYNISTPVDILNEEKFEYEVNQLGSNRSKADAIRTRMIKRITERYDENPAYYDKFSKRIQEILDQYKEKRISDGEYLDKLNRVKTDLRQGYSGMAFPIMIKNNGNAQAFYGVVKEKVDAFENIKDTFDQEDYEDILAELAIRITETINKNSKVDWHDNPDVHKIITRDLNDVFYEYKNKYFKDLSYPIIDRIVKDIMTVALRRY